jgi:hypothetical protein
MSGLIAGAVASGIGAVTGVISAINASDAQERALTQQFVAGQQQIRNDKTLQEALMKANSDDARMKILADSTSMIYSAKITALVSGQLNAQALQKTTEQKNLVITSIGGGIILVGSLAVLKFA